LNYPSVFAGLGLSLRIVTEKLLHGPIENNVRMLAPYGGQKLAASVQEKLLRLSTTYNSPKRIFNSQQLRRP